MMPWTSLTGPLSVVEVVFHILTPLLLGSHLVRPFPGAPDA